MGEYMDLLKAAEGDPDRLEAAEAKFQAAVRAARDTSTLSEPDWDKPVDKSVPDILRCAAHEAYCWTAEYDQTDPRDWIVLEGACADCQKFLEAMDLLSRITRPEEPTPLTPYEECRKRLKEEKIMPCNHQISPCQCEVDVLEGEIEKLKGEQALAEERAGEAEAERDEKTWKIAAQASTNHDLREQLATLTAERDRLREERDEARTWLKKALVRLEICGEKDSFLFKHVTKMLDIPEQG